MRGKGFKVMDWQDDWGKIRKNCHKEQREEGRGKRVKVGGMLPKITELGSLDGSAETCCPPSPRTPRKGIMSIMLIE